MSTLHAIITIAVFAGVILAIAFNLLDLTVAALLGVSVLLVMGILTAGDALHALETAGGTLALLFGGMVVARTLQPTGIFENAGTRFLILTKGSGKLYLLGLFVLITPICAFLPNATVVILVAPIIIASQPPLKSTMWDPWSSPPLSATPRACSPWWEILPRFWWGAPSA